MKYIINIKNSIPPLILVLSMLLMTDCDDTWDEHYNQENFDIADYTLTEAIEQENQVSTFYKMLELAGYDDILNYPQSFTVWAPVNDALSGIDLTDSSAVAALVKNHITRGKISTSNLSDLSIRMLNGKNIDFESNGTEYTFGDQTLTSSDGVASNGILHVINGYVPIENNLWEFIEEHDNLDSLYSYLYGLSSYVFDASSSTELGVDDDGQVLYDSVFTSSNPVFEELGYLDNEDSTYTVIMPDNDAWTEAYDRIVDYFNFPENAGSSERQREKTEYTLIQDMIFKGKIEDPSSQASMVSTYGNIFYNPTDLYANVTETYSLSNGIANVTTQMPFSDTSSWFKEIRVEAEESDNRSNSNNVVYTKTGYGSDLDISDEKYILVDPSGSESTVEFAIPNTLSATYNIYCVFVPASISDETDYTPAKVTFELTYIRRSGGSTFFKEITPDMNSTYPIGLTKMFVTQYDFEYANIIDDDYENIAVKLKVINNVTSAEQQSGEYSRTMRIDCIILEPVFE